MVIALFARGFGLPDIVMKTLYLIGSVWMVFTLYMVPALLLLDVARVVGLPIRNGVLLAAGVVVCILLYGYWNYRNPRVEHIDIELDKFLECDLRIVAISDIHLGDGTGKRALGRYVDLINAQRPDLIVVGGDLIDNSLVPVLRNNMAEELCRLDAPMGIYMAPGNHEYISGIDESLDFIATTPIVVLRDSVAMLDEGVAIIGRDDRMNRRRKSTEELVASIPADRFTIVVDHQPYDIATSERLGIDLHLSGHTHRGQVWPLNWLTDALYEQSHGHRLWGATSAYVMQGLSLWGPPFRIGTKSEIVVIDLKADNTTTSD
jgi:predicted MPP superfamily phosphohydrolase